MESRTVLLVSHHILLCGPGSKHVLALENGRVQYSGAWKSFRGSAVMNSILVSSGSGIEHAGIVVEDEVEQIYDTTQPVVEAKIPPQVPQANSETEPTAPVPRSSKARKLVQEESRFEGRISLDVWTLYARACGSLWFWTLCLSVLLLSCMSPVWENGWLKYVYFFAFPFV